ncbi:MAG: PEP-CTERM sorting domain-containing protein [Planctomycetota bacterium]
MKRVFGAGFAVVLCVLMGFGGSEATAQPVIEVGNVVLAPDTAGQEVEISVTGGQPVETLNLLVQIEDGLNVAGPTIQGVDLITGTIFENDNDGGQFDVDTDPQFFSTGVVTPFTIPATTVAADGLIATILVDTTGISSGVFDLKLADTLLGDTDFGFDENFLPIEPTIVNGTITVVIPEPGTGALLGLVVVAGLLRRRRQG